MTRYLSIALTFCLAACGAGGGGGTASRESAKPSTPSAAGDARELRIPPDLQKKWGVVTGPVERIPVTGALRLPGVLSLNQQRSARIATLLDGTIVSVNADLGDQVKKDQVLVVVRSPAFAQAQTSFLQAAAHRAVARRELERARELLKEEAIQQKEFQRREAEYDAASTDYGLAESNLHSLGWGHAQIDDMVQRAAKVNGDLSDLVEPFLRLRSPIDGRIIARDVIVGEHVAPEKVLFSVSDLSTLWALLDAREQDLPLLAAGGRVSIESQVYPGRPFQGRLARVGDVVDEKLRTIQVRVDVPNPSLLLKPNMYIQGMVPGGGRAHDVLAVPEDAVQSINGEPAVFVVAADKGFAVRPVQVGDLVGASRAITKGLDGTETVVVAGAFNLKAELLKSSFAGE